VVGPSIEAVNKTTSMSETPSHRTPRHSGVDRRTAIAGAVIGSAAVAGITQSTFAVEEKTSMSVDAKSGKLKQSVCKWCFPKISLPDLAKQVASMGMVGIDLLDPVDFSTLKEHGLVCTMVQSHPLTDGLCDPKFHDKCLEKMNVAIEATSAEGWRNVICFSGNGRGIERFVRCPVVDAVFQYLTGSDE